MTPAMRRQTLRDPIVRLLAERLALLHPKALYLFGSRARGQADAASDYDVLVLVDGPVDRVRFLEREAYRVLDDVEAPVDVVVMTADHFERRRGVAASFAATVAREGLALHA